MGGTNECKVILEGRVYLLEKRWSNRQLIRKSGDAVWGTGARQGSAQHNMVTKIEGDNVTIDINYPLAEVALNFDIKIFSVREATKEELDHGHTHEDGHSH